MAHRKWERENRNTNMHMREKERVRTEEACTWSELERESEIIPHVSIEGLNAWQEEEMRNS
jgi:hypothetical protein